MKTFYKYRIKIDTRADGTKHYYAQVMEYTALTFVWSVITLPFKIIVFIVTFFNVIRDGKELWDMWYCHFKYETIDKISHNPDWSFDSEEHPELYVLLTLQEAEDVIHAHKKRMDHLEEISKNKVAYIPPDTITKTEYHKYNP